MEGLYCNCICLNYLLCCEDISNSDADQERCLSSYTSLSAIRYLHLLLNTDTLYQTTDFYNSIENDRLKMQSSIIDMKNSLRPQ